VLALNQAVWLVLPVVIAGLIHITVIRFDLLPELGRWPLDGYLTCRGRRLLGRNKTVRGALVMMVTTAVATALLARAGGGMHPRLAVAALQVAHPWAWGLLLGIGYFIGELPNSFFKRQLGIAPGAIASGASGAVFWVTDQLDSVAGVLLALSTVWRPDVAVVVCIVGLALLLHPLVAALMVMLGLKDRIG
jgi:CDP-diglyceride synthetase